MLNIYILCFFLIIPVNVYAKSFDEFVYSFDKIDFVANPFVTIFIDGGCDGCPYGFITNKKLFKKDWISIFSHFGHLSAYSNFKPADKRQWRVDDRDIPVLAAQSLNLPTGGCIMGAPATQSECDNVISAFSQPISLKMTHFFHDDENFMGVPGGHGSNRLRVYGGGKSVKLQTTSPISLSSLFKSNFSSIKFGLYVSDFIYGNRFDIFGTSRFVDSRIDRNDLVVGYENEGGYFGENFITLRIDNVKYKSLPFNVYSASQWLNVEISILNTLGRKVQLSVIVNNFEILNKVIPEPDVYDSFLYINTPSRNYFDIDSLTFESRNDSKSSILFSCEFENFDMFGSNKYFKDESRGNNFCTSFGEKFQIFPVIGITEKEKLRLQIPFIDKFNVVRNAYGASKPELTTNWRLADVNNRFEVWNKIGFTHNSSVYYYYGNHKGDLSKLGSILLGRLPIESRQSSKNLAWCHAWIGNVYPNDDVLSPYEFGLLIAMSVLEGNRWFTVFTAMSSGSLGINGLSREDTAYINADAIYNMVSVANKFEEHKINFEKSEYLHFKQSESFITRGRVNKTTNEIWFMSCPRKKNVVYNGDCKIFISNKNGILKNLFTNDVVELDSGYLKINNNTVNQLYYFCPK